MIIPLYRIKELKSIYHIYCDQSSEILPIKRKKELYKIIKSKYKWFSSQEYNVFYSQIETEEIERYLKYQQSNFSQKYKKLICKLFSSMDQNNDLAIDLSEFQSIIIKLNLGNQNQITKIFNKFDTNKDGVMDIDEFINFLVQNESIIQQLDQILNYKFEQNKNNDIRNLLFNNFPGSPIKSNWRPSLFNVRSLNYIKEKLILYQKVV